jgi:peptidoglycan/xylan/chitin deacetylase (PgdA/CDA1 family)
MTESRRRTTGRRAFLAGMGAAAGGAAGLRLGTGRAGAGEPDGVLPIEHQLQVPHEGTHRIVWSIDTDRPRVALTFDDGPDPRLTPQVLEILDDFGITATFLMMGHNAELHPELARQVVDAGHEIGNHTATHLDLGKHPEEICRAEIEDAARQIETATGQDLRWFRPPRGQLSAWSIRFAALQGYDTVMWSLSRGEDGTADDVVAHLSQMAPGDVILLHDGRGRGTFEPDEPFAQDLLRRRLVELEALPRVLADARDRGLELVTVSELMAGERRPLAS